MAIPLSSLLAADSPPPCAPNSCAQGSHAQGSHAQSPQAPSAARIHGLLEALGRSGEGRDAGPPRWVILLELDDPDLIEALRARGLRLILVLPQAWRVQRLAEAIDAIDTPGFRLCDQLFAAESGEVCWYTYNDPRCDGTRSPGELEADRPNLRLESLEMRPQHTLDSLRHAWTERDGPLEGEGLLLLRDADQLALLAGGGSLLADLAALAWFAPGEANTPPGALLPALASHFLVPWPEAEPGHWWRRDAALELRAENRELHQLWTDSTRHLDQLRGEREAIAQRQLELQAERDALLQSQAGLAAQLAIQQGLASRLAQQLEAERAEAEAQRAAAAQVQAELERSGEEVALLRQRAELQQNEGEALQAELAGVRAQLEVLQAGCDQLQQERDHTVAEREQARAACEQSQERITALQAESERLREDLQEALRLRQGHQEQLATLTLRADHSSRALEELRLELARLIEAGARPAEAP